MCPSKRRFGCSQRNIICYQSNRTVIGNINRTWALILIAAIAVSCLGALAVKPANAQSATPSTPEFTLKIVDSMTGGGLQTEIQNQPIIPNGHDTAGIFYDFRYKWHESSSWYHPEPDLTEWHRQYVSETGTNGVTTMVWSPNSYYEIRGNTNTQELDIQIRAINGYQNTTYPYVPPIGIEPGDNPIIIVSASDWSPTQTITLPAYSVVPTQTPIPAQPSSAVTATPIQTTNETTVNGVPSIPFLLLTTAVTLVVIAVLLAVIVALLFLMKRRQIAKQP